MNDIRISEDNKINIINNFANIASTVVNNRNIIDKNFQKSRYAKNMKLLARGILPKEYRYTKPVYTRNEHINYITQQIEHKKTLKLKRRLINGN